MFLQLKSIMARYGAGYITDISLPSRRPSERPKYHPSPYVTAVKITEEVSHFQSCVRINYLHDIALYYGRQYYTNIYACSSETTEFFRFFVLLYFALTCYSVTVMQLDRRYGRESLFFHSLLILTSFLVIPSPIFLRVLVSFNLSSFSSVFLFFFFYFFLILCLSFSLFFSSS